MRILQLVDEPWDSGLTQYALTLTRGLHAQGHQVAVAAVPNGPAWRQVAQWGIPTVPVQGWSDLPALRSWVRSHAVDVLNPHTGRSHSLAACAGDGRSVLIRTRADARPVQRRFGQRWLFSQTERIIAAADFIRQQYLEQLLGGGIQVTTIHQGINVQEYPVYPLPPSGSLTVGMVARLDPVKGHRVALQAFHEVVRDIPQSRLVLAGPPANFSLEALKTWVQERRLEHAVEVRGYVQEVLPLMGSCQIGVIPSLGSEAVSRVALEWMAAGRALIVTRVGCLPELVVDGETGYVVPPGDGRAIAQAVTQLLHNPSLVTRMGLAARHRVETHFSLHQFVKRTEEVYTNALAHRPS